MRKLTQRLRGAATLSLLAAGVSVPTQAQDTLRLARSLDSVHMLQMATAAALTALDGTHVRMERLYPDTVLMLDGKLRLLSGATLAPLTRAATALADPMIRTRAGGAASRITGMTLAVWEDSALRAANALGVSSQLGAASGDERVILRDAAALADEIEQRLQHQIGATGHPVFMSWLSNALPRAPAADAEWRAIRLGLVSSPATVARRCHDGSLAACRETLGLTVSSDPARAWFDSAGRRAVVSDLKGRIDAQVPARCLAGSDSACIALIDGNPLFAGSRHPPGSFGARLALVQVAFELGETGSLERLASSADTPSAAIVAIAGMPLDTVVARWQRRAHDGGISSQNSTSVVALSAIGWFLALGTLATRSSRWR